jgi:hypothetical protein
MFNPIKAIKTEITENVANLRAMRAEYRYEKMILASQAKLAETTLDRIRVNFMAHNETNPPKKETPMTTTPQTTKVEEFGNGIFIKWKITIN